MAKSDVEDGSDILVKQMHSSKFELVQSFIPMLRELQPGKTKKALTRLGLLFLYAMVCIFIMSIANTGASIRQQGPNSTVKGRPPQPDLIFDIIPPMAKLNHMPDIMLFLMLFGTFVRFLFHPRGLTALRRFLAIYASLTLLRATTIATTTFSDPADGFSIDPCGGSYTPPSDAHEFWMATLVPKGMITCGDLMFSGHSLVFTSLALGWLTYTKTIIERVLTVVYTLVGYFSLIALRLHYTDDILVAIYINTLVWVLYHVIAMEPCLRKSWRLIYLLEEDIIEIDEEHSRSYSTVPSEEQQPLSRFVN